MRNGPPEYADTGNAGDDEELTPPSRRPTALRRLRGDIAVAIVVLIGAVLLARGLSGGNHTAAGTPTPAPTGSGTLPPTGPPPRGVLTYGAPTSVPRETLIDTEPCPHTQRPGSECTTTHAVPAPFVAAVHRAFPHVVVDSAVTAVLHSSGAGSTASRMWSRMVAAHDRHSYLIVVVSRNGPPGSSAHFGVTPGETTYYIRAQHVPYTVQVQAVELSNGGPSLSTITELANDPRLVRRG